MTSQHKITFTKSEFESHIKEGKLRIEADVFLGDKVVKHCKAPVIFKLGKKRDSIELTFVGFD
jgi:hypothetical protein